MPLTTFGELQGPLKYFSSHLAETHSRDGLQGKSIGHVAETIRKTRATFGELQLSDAAMSRRSDASYEIF